MARIYFSDYFEVAPKLLQEYGAFDVSLVNDLPLFIDPFLIFHSQEERFKELHRRIIRYVRFLRDKSIAGEISEELLEAWFTFREVKENWFGFSKTGNGGRGLGMEFARILNANLSKIFQTFGAEVVTKGSHIEKLCLIADGVGKDSVSDFVTNLVKDFLAEYTQEFAQRHLRADQIRRIPLRKARFNYETESWETVSYDLPYVNGGHVLLSPSSILTKLEVWINRADLTREYVEVASSIDNDQLRGLLNNYFVRQLNQIQERDEEKARERAKARKRANSRSRARASNKPQARPLPAPTQSQVEEAAASVIQQFPEVIDYYIRWKEDHGDDAKTTAQARVSQTEQQYVVQVRELVDKLEAATDFFRLSGSTIEEARARVEYLKDVIENKAGWRLFYDGDDVTGREEDVQILFRLVWCGTPSDVNREVNNGRGPSDFEVSRGRLDKSIIEFKLARNSQLAKNLEHQAEIYKQASDAQHALKVVVYFTESELKKAERILKALGLQGHPDIYLIDARRDNKLSASKADSH